MQYAGNYYHPVGYIIKNCP